MSGPPQLKSLKNQTSVRKRTRRQQGGNAMIIVLKPGANEAEGRTL
jgi:hypothetical protein